MAVFTVLKLYMVAMLSSVASLVISVIILITSAPGAAPHASGAAALLVLASTRPWNCIIALLIVVTGFLLIILAGKYTVNKVVHRIVSDKSENTILPLLNKVIEQFRQGRPAAMDKVSEATWSKMRLIQEVKEHSENPWVRRALVFAFKKARLEDIDLARQDMQLSELIRDRTMLAIREMSTPDKSLFWIVIGIQWVLVLTAYLI